jgi:hypothetical protein
MFLLSIRRRGTPFAIACPEGPQRPVLGQESQAMNNALVPVAAFRSENPGAFADRRTNADFIAHLIATALQAPQTRARRRAEPQDAFAAYRALGQRPTPPGRAVSRSL